MTWKEVQEATLHKLDAARDGTVDLTAPENADWVAAMPQAATEGMLYLCGTVRPLRRCAVFTAKGPVARIDQIAPDFRAAGVPEAWQLPAEGSGAAPVPFSPRVLGGRLLLLPDGVKGQVAWFYDALPPRITADTPPDTALPLAEDAAVLLPLYMASQLGKSQDAALATVWRNEFQAALEALPGAGEGATDAAFVSETGWA